MGVRARQKRPFPFPIPPSQILHTNPLFSSPLCQLPNLRLPVGAEFADVGVEGGGLFEVVHGGGVLPGGVVEVGEVVVEGGLAVAVALGLAEGEGGLQGGDAGRKTAVFPIHQPQIIQRRNPCRGVGQRFRQGQAVVKVRLRCGKIGLVARQRAQQVVDLRQRLAVVGLLRQGEGLPRQRQCLVGLIAVVGVAAAVGQQAGGAGDSLRRQKMAFGRFPTAAPLVDKPQLVFQLGDCELTIGGEVTNGRFIPPNRRLIPPQQRVEIAHRFIENGRFPMPQRQRRFVIGQRFPIGKQ